MSVPEISTKERMENLTDEQKAMLAAQKERFMARHGMTSEEFDKYVSYPCNLKLMLAGDVMFKYRIVAEAVESKYCGAGIKVGDRFIFQTVPNMFLPEESTAPCCIKALGPLADHMHGIWERLFEHLDPNDGMTVHVPCMDMGLDYGGLGHVVFRLFCEEIPENERKMPGQK